jgi:hypothetical protein
MRIDMIPLSKLTLFKNNEINGTINSSDISSSNPVIGLSFSIPSSKISKEILTPTGWVLLK